MVCSFDLTLTNLIFLGVLAFALKKLYKMFQTWKVEKMLEKWSNTPKDRVILHTLTRSKPLPSISPFSLKLETYLRLAKIPYEIDTVDYRGPKGKLPWITYNGVHVADSHFCIKYLNKKLAINLNTGKPEETIATARACRMMLEQHFIWGLVQYRWKDNVGAFSQLMKLPTFLKVFLPIISARIANSMERNGIGLHSVTEIYQITEDDLTTVSKLLGDKKFFGGESPCEDDCAIFGSIAQAAWGSPGSAFEKLVHGEFSNLKQYCERMKQLGWPDWDDCVDKS